MAEFNFQKYFGEIAPLSDALREEEQRGWEMAVPLNPKPSEFVLYLGCNVLRTVNLAESVVEILRYLDVDFTAVGGAANCCGIVHDRNGDKKSGDKIRHHSLGKLASFQPKQVLTFCPTCHNRMDEVVADREAFDVPYRHLSEFFVDNLGRMKFVNRVERRVVLHTHGTVAQQQKDGVMTRTLLDAIPGLEVTVPPPLEEMGYTCSPAIIEKIGEPRYQEIVDGIFADAKEEGADAVIATYHGCYRRFCDWEENTGLEVLHYATLLCQSLGLRRYKDSYKSHRLAGDPEGAFQALRPTAEKRGINMKKLREATGTHFTTGKNPMNA